MQDMGGLRCHGSIEVEPDEPTFHAEWERRVLGLVLAAGSCGMWNIDTSRAARESLPAAFYLSAGYYRIWLAGLEKLLLQTGMVTAEELASGGRALEKPVPVKHPIRPEQVEAQLAAGSPVSRPSNTEACFIVGDHVLVRNHQPATHTRLPAYIRGHQGIVTRIHGCHVYPDSNALGLGEDPHWLYSVRFEASELWGESADPSAGCVQVDCWEPYLERVKTR